MENTYCIYVHTNKLDGKRYVGQTKRTPTTRWGIGGSNYSGSRFFYNAILKNGWDNFEHEILIKGLDKNQADFYEKEYIKLFKSNNPNFGYNLTDGGHFCKKTVEARKNVCGKNNHFYGKHHTKETKEKISNYLKRNQKRRFGWHHTEEAKKKMRLAAKNKIVSEETRKKLSIARSGEKNPFYGKHWTAEQRENQRMKLLGRKASLETRKKLTEANLRKVKNGTHPSAGKFGKDNPNYGKRFFNNGLVNVFCLECPEGFIPGMIYKKRNEQYWQKFKKRGVE